MAGKNLGKIVIGTLLAGASALIMGCSEKPKQYVTYSGEPLSTSYTHPPASLTLSVVIKADGKAFVGSCRPNSDEKLSNANALVQSEISDGDNEKMEMTGYYTTSGNFKITYIKANGCSMNLVNPADWD